MTKQQLIDSLYPPDLEEGDEEVREYNRQIREKIRKMEGKE